MPRSENAEIVYVLLAIDEEGVPDSVEVHGTRSEAENAAEALARAEGYSTKDSRFIDTGELIATTRRNSKPASTGIFVLQRKVIRKPRVLKGKPNA